MIISNKEVLSVIKTLREPIYVVESETHLYVLDHITLVKVKKDAVTGSANEKHSVDTKTLPVLDQDVESWFGDLQKSLRPVWPPASKYPISSLITHWTLEVNKRVRNAIFSINYRRLLWLKNVHINEAGVFSARRRNNWRGLYCAADDFEVVISALWFPLEKS